jgi:hypothetical protein
MEIDIMRLPLAFLLAVLPSWATAHPDDETRIVQGAYLTVKPAEIRLELNLIPGTRITNDFLAEVDIDANGEVTSEEAGTFAQSVLSQSELSWDGQPLEWVLDIVSIPSSDELADGSDFVRIFALAQRVDTVGDHTLHYINNFGPLESQWLASTFFMPSGGMRYVVTGQEASEDGRSTTITYRAS